MKNRVRQEIKMDSDDQESVYSVESPSSNKSLIYESRDEESSTCDTIITHFNYCKVNCENYEQIALRPVNEETQELNITEDIAVIEIPMSSVCDFEKPAESIATSVSNDIKKHSCDKSTNTENSLYKRKMFGQAKNTYYKCRPYRYNHQQFSNYHRNNYHRNNYHNNYYRKPFYNNYQQNHFNYMNRYQNPRFCNKWDCEMRHRRNQYFNTMLFRGIFHFTKFLEYLAHTHY